MTSYRGYTITKEDSLFIVEAFDLACSTLKAAKGFIDRHLDLQPGATLRGRTLL